MEMSPAQKLQQFLHQEQESLQQDHCGGDALWLELLSFLNPACCHDDRERVATLQVFSDALSLPYLRGVVQEKTFEVFYLVLDWSCPFQDVTQGVPELEKILVCAESASDPRELFTAICEKLEDERLQREIRLLLVTVLARATARLTRHRSRFLASAVQLLTPIFNDLIEAQPDASHQPELAGNEDEFQVQIANESGTPQPLCEKTWRRNFEVFEAVTTFARAAAQALREKCSVMPDDVPQERRVFTYLTFSLLSWAGEQPHFAEEDSPLWPLVKQLLVDVAECGPPEWELLDHQRSVRRQHDDITRKRKQQRQIQVYRGGADTVEEGERILDGSLHPEEDMADLDDDVLEFPSCGIGLYLYFTRVVPVVQVSPFNPFSAQHHFLLASTFADSMLENQSPGIQERGLDLFEHLLHGLTASSHTLLCTTSRVSFQAVRSLVESLLTVLVYSSHESIRKRAYNGAQSLLDKCALPLRFDLLCKLLRGGTSSSVSSVLVHRLKSEVNKVVEMWRTSSQHHPPLDAYQLLSPRVPRLLFGVSKSFVRDPVEGVDALMSCCNAFRYLLLVSRPQACQVDPLPEQVRHAMSTEEPAHTPSLPVDGDAPWSPPDVWHVWSPDMLHSLRTYLLDPLHESAGKAVAQMSQDGESPSAPSSSSEGGQRARAALPTLWCLQDVCSRLYELVGRKGGGPPPASAAHVSPEEAVDGGMAS
mgnify:CR=1 FL=1